MGNGYGESTIGSSNQRTTLVSLTRGILACGYLADTWKLRLCTSLDLISLIFMFGSVPILYSYSPSLPTDALPLDSDGIFAIPVGLCRLTA